MENIICPAIDKDFICNNRFCISTKFCDLLLKSDRDMDDCYIWSEKEVNYSITLIPYCNNEDSIGE